MCGCLCLDFRGLSLRLLCGRLFNGLLLRLRRLRLNVLSQRSLSLSILSLTRLLRHARKMRARWARRMCPPARKARYGQGGPLRAGYSAAELRAWAQGRYPRSWFHWNHYKYYISGFFRRVALMRARSFWARGFCGDVCHAPLWPD